MSEPYIDPHEGEIDIRAMLEVLVRRKILITGITVMSVVVAIVLSLLLPRVYRSEAFYQLGIPQMDPLKEEDTPSTFGIAVPYFKNTSSQFWNPERIMAFALRRKDGTVSMDVVKRRFNEAGKINKWITPVYAYAKDDLRELAQVSAQEPNVVIGVNLRFEADSPQTAAAYVRFLGDYIQDCLIYVSLFNYIQEGAARAASELSRNENQIMDLSFELMMNEEKRKAIRTVMKEFPESAKIDFGQVISVQDGGNLYLPPVTQLIGLESQRAELNLSLSRVQREREKLEIRNRYYSQCHRSLIDMGEEGKPLLALLESVQSEVFQNEDLGREPVRLVLNDISRDLQNFEYTFSVQYRVISLLASSTPISPNRKAIVIIAFLLAITGSSAGVLSFHWWNHRGAFKKVG